MSYLLWAITLIGYSGSVPVSYHQLKVLIDTTNYIVAELLSTTQNLWTINNHFNDSLVLGCKAY